MMEPAAAAPPRPVRDGLVAGAGCALLAGLVLAIIDVILAARGPAGLGVAPVVLALWALPTLGFAAFAAVVGAGFGSAFGARPWARLRERPSLDRELAAAVLAVLLLLVVLSIGLKIASTVLIVKPERRPAGAASLGAVAIIAVLGLAAIGLPLQRLLARVTEKVPAIGGLSRTGLVAILAGVVLLWWVRHVVHRAGYDLAALPLGGLTMLVMLPVLTIVFAAVLYGPLAGLRARVPARGAIVAAGAAVAVVLAAMAMRQPGEKVARSVTDRGAGSSLLVVAGRLFLDRDGDGYSAFFRGPDCDDTRKDVNPGAKEVPNNGLDDNCQGGDYTGPATAVGAGSGSAAGSAAGSASGSGSGSGSAPATPALAKNVVIIMIDTLRADRLGAAGYQRDGASMTPRIDDFLGKAVWFRHVYAQANNTPRSIPSFMSSRYPSAMVVDKIHAKYSRIDDSNDLLFEQLQAAGLHTIGEASHFYFNPERNITQGFDVFDNDGALDVKGSNKDIAAPRIVPRVEAQLAELGKSKQRFAMFVHLFEPHSSFVEHEGDPPVTEGGTAKWSHLYDYEVRFVDAHVGKILDAIDASGLAGDTVVVLLSDHGESFGEQSFAGQSMFHGTNLYDPQIRVPLAFRVPGQPPRKLDDVAELLDLAPTVAALVGASPSPKWMGRSLLPAITGGTLPPEPAFSELLAYPGWEQDIKLAVSADGAWKLHDILSQRRMELYHLTDDPGEQHDLFGKPAVAAEQQKMLDLLNEFVEVKLAQ